MVSLKLLALLSEKSFQCQTKNKVAEVSATYVYRCLDDNMSQVFDMNMSLLALSSCIF